MRRSIRCRRAWAGTTRRLRLLSSRSSPTRGRLTSLYWGEAERDPQRVVQTTLNQQAYVADSQWYGDVRLVRYATPREPVLVEASGARFGESITLERFALSDTALHPGDILQVRLDWQTDAPLDTRYKVSVQVLDSAGRLIAQHDSEPGGGQILTTHLDTRGDRARPPRLSTP